MGSIRVEAGLGCDLSRSKSASGLTVLLLRASHPSRIRKGEKSKQ